MMKTVVSSEKLIQLVKDRPHLWAHSRSPAIECRWQREESWMEIGMEFVGEDWASFSEGERSAYVTQLKKRWKNLRDNFMKSIQRPPDDLRRKYYYAEKMNFILEDDKHKTKQSELTDEDPLMTCEESNGEPASKIFKTPSSDDGEMTSFVKIENCQPEMDQPGMEYEVAEESEEPAIQPPLKEPEVIRRAAPELRERPKSVQDQEHNQSRKKPQSSPDEFEREILKILKAQVQQQKPPQPLPSTAEMISDPDAMFLLSQLPYIKTLNQSDRLDFRVKFMQFLQSFMKQAGKYHKEAIDSSSPTELSQHST